ncbi:uncharacterized protein LOC121865019 isoform X1 [Homarus americanus]|nr:uncharacterized protein LOC121865019 isoform X1 [Homarus americanus]
MDQSNGTIDISEENIDVISLSVESPVKIDDTAPTMTSPVGSLALGCDSKEDWEELREAPHDSQQDLFSPILFRKKPPGRFTLTPVLSVSDNQRTEMKIPKSEVSNEKIDLSTPHQSLNYLLDCPRPPAKSRRVSVTPSAERSSCRHLFSQEISLSAPSASSCLTDHKEICEDGDEDKNKNLQTILSGHSACESTISTEAADIGKKNKEFLDDKALYFQGEEKPGFPCTPDEQQHALKSGPMCTPEAGELPPLIGSPHSDSSASSPCSDCAAAAFSFSSGSPLSSPNLSQVKLMSQTIESSASEVCDAEIAVTVAGPTEIRSSPDDGCASHPENAPNSEFSTKLYSDTEEGNAKAITGVNTGPSESTSVPVAALLKTQEPADNKLLSEVTSNTRNDIVLCDDNVKAAKVEINQTISSMGSTSSNWTAISGISPLPASDPAHPSRHHKHRHHHHHHHHHHAKHHHHSSHHSRGHSLSRTGDILVTSTPIHKKICLAEKVDVSAVTSTGAEFSPKESRFVLSSELQFTDSSTPSQSTTSEVEAPILGSQEGSSQPMRSSHSGSDKENIDPCCALGSQKSLHGKRPRTASQTESDNVKRERGEVVSLTQEGVTSTGIAASGHHAKKAKCTKSASFGRPLTKKEAEVLLATQVNFMDEVWDHLPSPRHSSSVDECLFRSMSLDPQLSITLE